MFRVTIHLPIYGNKRRANESVLFFHHQSPTDVDHFVRDGGKFVTETEFIDAIFFSDFLKVIVLFLRFLVQDFSRRTFQDYIHVIITTGDNLSDQERRFISLWHRHATNLKFEDERRASFELIIEAFLGIVRQFEG